MMFKGLIFAILALAFSIGPALASQHSEKDKARNPISIIGNSELPEVEVVLPWRVAEGSRSTDAELKILEMPDAGTPVGLETHRRQVFFDKHLKLLPEGFSKP